MRTFHAGGAASATGDITQGLPRVEEIFEKRTPKTPAIVARVTGSINEIKENGKEKIITILADEAGKSKKKADVEYTVPAGRTIFVSKGDKVEKGDVITDGSASIDEIFEYGGKEKAQNYIIAEVSKPYDLQGEAISRKHIEVIVRQMFSRVIIDSPGDTIFSIGDTVEYSNLEIENKRVKKLGLEEAKAEASVMGITEVSLTRKSFLSAASFQHTTRVLIDSAVRGKEDDLKGLMENVIIGRLIPAGTGFAKSPKNKMIADLQEKLDRKADGEII
jgi:DNA-directed RNA polymerase subunit beta'